MLVAELTERRTFSQTEKNSVGEALRIMNAESVSVLPVISEDESTWLGNVYRSDLIRQKNQKQALESFVQRDQNWVLYSSHVFDAAKLMQKQRVEVLAVVGENFHYEGFILRTSVSEQLMRLLNVEEPGRIIVVEMSESDFMLSQIVRFIEEEKSKILGLTVESATGMRENYRISIKLSTLDVGRILASLNRHGYQAFLADPEEMLDAEFSHRADELLHFLEL
jgi:acetoin utilization protein AcuB